MLLRNDTVILKSLDEIHSERPDLHVSSALWERISVIAGRTCTVTYVTTDGLLVQVDEISTMIPACFFKKERLVSFTKKVLDSVLF